MNKTGSTSTDDLSRLEWISRWKRLMVRASFRALKRNNFSGVFNENQSQSDRSILQLSRILLEMGKLDGFDSRMERALMIRMWIKGSLEQAQKSAGENNIPLLRLFHGWCREEAVAECDNEFHASLMSWYCKPTPDHQSFPPGTLLFYRTMD